MSRKKMGMDHGPVWMWMLRQRYAFLAMNSIADFLHRLGLLLVMVSSEGLGPAPLSGLRLIASLSSWASSSSSESECSDEGGLGRLGPAGLIEIR